MSINIFLLGTLDRNSPISILRGQTDILRIIFNLTCEEWWTLNIERIRYQNNIPDLTLPWQHGDYYHYPIERQICSGCPIATIAKNIEFPPISSIPNNTFKNQQNDILFINMMPFNYKKKESLPVCCQQYWPIIQECVRRAKRDSDINQRFIGYLSIDERPAEVGRSQRRGGLHVESPGILPIPGFENKKESGKYIPGLEHHWGNGMLLSQESIEGGIYFGSNLANTTAVWNCKIRDDHGDIIGPHGSIERIRDILGPPTRTLEAGEIVWLSDKTPHESLPLPQTSSNSPPPRRQFFRLVLGEVTAWFADHCTPNPIRNYIPSSVRIVRGNKYDLFNPSSCQILWVAGQFHDIERLKKENELRQLCFSSSLGHFSDRLIQNGFRTVEDIIKEAIEITEIQKLKNLYVSSIIWNRRKDIYPNLFPSEYGGYEMAKFVHLMEFLVLMITNITDNINSQPEFADIYSIIKNKISAKEFQSELHGYEFIDDGGF